MSKIDHYFDPEDMSCCVPGDRTLAEINEQAGEHDLYFPLVCDPERSIRDHITYTRFAPESFRFGSFADNILGMNICIKGQNIRVGGRVVKNVTGFDINRFLINSAHQCAEIKDLVLRLRPLAQERRILKLSGNHSNAQDFAKKVLLSSWSHVINSLDFCMDENSSGLYVSWLCDSTYQNIYEEALTAMIADTDLKSEQIESYPVISFDQIRVKCLPSQTMEIAAYLVKECQGKACGMLANGAILFEMDDPEKKGDTLLALHEELAADGGHLSCAALDYQLPAHEQAWYDKLMTGWSELEVADG